MYSSRYLFPNTQDTFLYRLWFFFNNSVLCNKPQGYKLWLVQIMQQLPFSFVLHKFGSYCRFIDVHRADCMRYLSLLHWVWLFLLKPQALCHKVGKELTIKTLFSLHVHMFYCSSSTLILASLLQHLFKMVHMLLWSDENSENGKAKTENWGFLWLLKTTSMHV